MVLSGRSVELISSFNTVNCPGEHLLQVFLFFQLSLQDVVPVLDLPAPPDGGWGWVIVAASFLCNFVLDGIAYSFGVLLPPLVEYFDSSR